MKIHNCRRTCSGRRWHALSKQPHFQGAVSRPMLAGWSNQYFSGARADGHERAATADGTGADRSRYSSTGRLAGMLLGPFGECLHRQAVTTVLLKCGEGSRRVPSGSMLTPVWVRILSGVVRVPSLENPAPWRGDACCRCRRRSRPRCRRSSSSFATIRNGAYGWHGAVQRQRALKIAAGRRRFPQLSIVFLGQHQKPLSRERVGLISHRGPALQSSCRTRHP